MTSLGMRTKPDANRAVANRQLHRLQGGRQCVGRLAAAHWPRFRLPQGGLHSANPNQGVQNYDLPDLADVSRYDAAVIFCARFHSVFDMAKLEKFEAGFALTPKTAH